MSFKPGKNAWFALDTIAGTLTNIQPYLDNVDVPQGVEMLEVSTLGTTAKAFIPGLSDGDVISISGPYDAAVYTHLTALKAGQLAGSSTATYTFGPGGSVASEAKQSAETWLKAFSVKTAVNGKGEWSAQLQVTGAVTNTVW